MHKLNASALWRRRENGRLYVKTPDEDKRERHVATGVRRSGQTAPKGTLRQPMQGPEPTIIMSFVMESCMKRHSKHR